MQGYLDSEVASEHHCLPKDLRWLALPPESPFPHIQSALGSVQFLFFTYLFWFDPRSGRSPGEGNGSPLQYSCLGNSMDRGTWWVAVHGVLWVRHDLVTKKQQNHLVDVEYILLFSCEFPNFQMRLTLYLNFLCVKYLFFYYNVSFWLLISFIYHVIYKVTCELHVSAINKKKNSNAG